MDIKHGGSSCPGGGFRLCRKIAELRRKKGLTQRELAEKIGVSAAAVGNYEQGVSFPKEEFLYRLFEALDCTPNELFGYEDKQAEAAPRAEAAPIAAPGAEASTEEESPAAIAARQGTDGGSVVLRKRGRKSIFDAPDYR